MLHSLKLKKPLAVIDLETTGVNVAKDRIVELCVVKAMPDGTTEIKTKRINPGIPIPLATSLIHGIYDEDVKDAPNFKQIGKSLSQFLDGCDFAGFNSNRFDIPMLVEEFLRNEIEFDARNRKFVDVQRIFHQMEPRNLSAAYKFYTGKPMINAHSAEADTLATLEVLCSQISRYEGVKIKDNKDEEYEPVINDMEALHNFTSGQIVDFAQTMAMNSKNEIVFNFGKHKGKTVKEILKREPNYYDWMQNGDFALDTKRKLTEIKLSMMNDRV